MPKTTKKDQKRDRLRKKTTKLSTVMGSARAKAFYPRDIPTNVPYNTVVEWDALMSSFLLPTFFVSKSPVPRMYSIDMNIIRANSLYNTSGQTYMWCHYRNVTRAIKSIACPMTIVKTCLSGREDRERYRYQGLWACDGV
jgi:hypothetical protein